MSKPQVRMMFPGAVTSKGFYSNYQYMIEPNAEHIYVIKGGPGVGKSTFMKKIGQVMLEQGYDIEYHCCSSDNNSIDGLVIPELNIALLDGTAPHIVDPKNPGAVDEIINLGEYWDEGKIRAAKKEIMDCNYKVGRFFQAAYIALQEAQIALSEWEFYVSEQQDWAQVGQMLLKVEQDLFKSPSKGRGRERHLFAWAHSPQGKVEFIDSLLGGIKTLYSLEGQPGTGKSTFLSQIKERALLFGWDVETYHNSLEPQKIDLVIIPKLATALVVNAEPYPYIPKIPVSMIQLNFDFLNPGISLYQETIEDCRQRVAQSLERALKNSKQAKATHDLMETYYIPAMDFAAIETKRRDILRKILDFAGQQAIAVSRIPKSTDI